jgi:hypothetical protein
MYRPDEHPAAARRAVRRRRGGTPAGGAAESAAGRRARAVGHEAPFAHHDMQGGPPDTTIARWRAVAGTIPPPASPFARLSGNPSPQAVNSTHSPTPWKA